MIPLECMEGPVENQIPGLTREPEGSLTIPFLALTPREGTSSETMVAALSKFSLDNPDTVKSFFDLFDAIPVSDLKDLKNDPEDNSFGGVYALMRRRTKKLLENDDKVTTISRQLAPLIYGKETGVAPETIHQFFKGEVASFAVESEDKGIQEAALNTLARIEPSIIEDLTPEAGTNFGKRNIQDTLNVILEKIVEALPPKRALQLGGLGAGIAVGLAACGEVAPIAGVKIISGNNPMIPTSAEVWDSGTAVAFNTVQAEQQPSPVVIAPAPSPTATLEKPSPTPPATETEIASPTPPATATEIASLTSESTNTTSPTEASTTIPKGDGSVEEQNTPLPGDRMIPFFPVQIIEETLKENPGYKEQWGNIYVLEIKYNPITKQSEVKFLSDSDIKNTIKTKLASSSLSEEEKNDPESTIQTYWQKCVEFFQTHQILGYKASEIVKAQMDPKTLECHYDAEPNPMVVP